MKFLKGFLTVILSIILSGLLIVLPYLAAFNNSIISSDALADSIIKSGISKDIKQVIDESIDDAINQVETNLKGEQNSTQIDDSTIEEVKDEVTNTLKAFNTEDNINALLKSIIELSYEQQDLRINDVFKNNLDKVIKDNNINISNETQTQINDFIDEVTTNFNKEINASLDGQVKINEERNAIINPIPEYINLSKKIQNTIIICIIVLIVIILLINLHSIRFGLKTIMGNLITAGIITLFSTFSISCFKNIVFESLSDSIYELFENIASSLISNATTVGIIYLVSGILILIGLIVSKQIIEKRQSEIV